MSDHSNNITRTRRKSSQGVDLCASPFDRVATMLLRSRFIPILTQSSRLRQSTLELVAGVRNPTGSDSCNWPSWRRESRSRIGMLAEGWPSVAAICRPAPTSVPVSPSQGQGVGAGTLASNSVHAFSVASSGVKPVP
jgi:hypothetical protein